MRRGELNNRKNAYSLLWGVGRKGVGEAEGGRGRGWGESFEDPGLTTVDIFYLGRNRIRICRIITDVTGYLWWGWTYDYFIQR